MDGSSRRSPTKCKCRPATHMCDHAPCILECGHRAPPSYVLFKGMMRAPCWRTVGFVWCRWWYTRMASCTSRDTALKEQHSKCIVGAVSFVLPKNTPLTFRVRSSYSTGVCSHKMSLRWCGPLIQIVSPVRSWEVWIIGRPNKGEFFVFCFADPHDGCFMTHHGRL